jgi:demethylmenaquinone methyltransferase/2-methoxy-6-polyprenyl-1,4-benzoquinol methylase
VWLPFVGGRVTGDGEAYAYLDKSSQAFPAGPAFVTRLEAAGFRSVRFRTLSFGSVFLYVADA